MNGRILHFRQNRHSTTGHHILIEVDGVGSREAAEKLVGKKVTWNSGKSEISGEIAAPHGNSGVLRAIFEKGLPGQAITTDVKIA